MILDTLDRALRYAPCHPGLAAGFAFLQQPHLEALAAGVHDIDGQRLFAIVARDQGRGLEGAVLEVHRKYIDIQYVVSGHEMIGWQALTHCRQEKQAYDDSSDLGFFSDRPQSWLEILPQSFVIFFPEDAHAPLASTGLVHKIVLKVAVDSR